MFFSVITKNLNLKIFTRNLATFERLDGVKDKMSYYDGGSQKNLIFRGKGVSGKTIYRGIA